MMVTRPLVNEFFAYLSEGNHSKTRNAYIGTLPRGFKDLGHADFTSDMEKLAKARPA